MYLNKNASEWNKEITDFLWNFIIQISGIYNRLYSCIKTIVYLFQIFFVHLLKRETSYPAIFKNVKEHGTDSSINVVESSSW